MTKVWVTRTQPAADQSCARLRALGYEAVAGPLLTITPPDIMPTIPPRDAHLIFTSGNGVRAFCTLTGRRHWPVIAVGDSTAHLARSCGFTTVRSAQGTSEDVIALILSDGQQGQPYVHCAGAHVRGRITERLTEAGYTAQRTVLYQSNPVSIASIADVSSITDILLYSPQAARTLRALYLDTLYADISHCRIISISTATDAAFTDAALGSIKTGPRLIARAPDEPAMFDALGA